MITGLCHLIDQIDTVTAYGGIFDHKIWQIQSFIVWNFFCFYKKITFNRLYCLFVHFLFLFKFGPGQIVFVLAYKIAIDKKLHRS